MQKLTELRERIATVESIQTVTQTLATVSAAKLSKTRARAAGLRLYAQRMRDALARQHAWLRASGVAPEAISPFLAEASDVRAVLLLHLAADRGMCGNHNIVANRRSVRFANEHAAESRQVSVVVKGLKGERPVRAHTAATVTHVEGWNRAGVTEDEVSRLCEMLTRPFLEGGVQQVWATYTEFHTPLRRVPRTVRLLPLGLPDDDPGDDEGWWSHEPEAVPVLRDLVAEFVRVQVEEVLLQSYASEQGARMITMEEATERAGKTLQECQVLYNRLRRESITTDLLGSLFATSLRQDGDVAREGA